MSFSGRYNVQELRAINCVDPLDLIPRDVQYQRPANRLFLIFFD